MNSIFQWRLMFALVSFCCLLLTPLPVFGRRTLNELIDLIFTKPTRCIRSSFFPNQPDIDGFFTDSINYLILLTLAAFLSVVLYFVIIKIPELWKNRAIEFLQTSIIYLLAWTFLIYGFSKLLGNQFPKITLDLEPTAENRDILFWSWIGRYPIVYYLVGFFEILVALALFIRKTRTLGLMAYSFAMIFILIINLRFNIGVVVFSFVLLFSSVNALYAYKTYLKDYITLPNHLHQPLKFLSIFILLIAAYFQDSY